MKTILGGQLWSVKKKKLCTGQKKKNKTVKSKNKNNWITSYACCSPVILTMHDFPNERSASGKDIQKRREEEEREKNAFRKRRNNINWHGKVDRVHLKTSSSLLNLLESSGKPSSTPDSATGIAVPGRKTCAAQRHLDRRPSMGGPVGDITATRITLTGTKRPQRCEPGCTDISTQNKVPISTV